MIIDGVKTEVEHKLIKNNTLCAIDFEFKYPADADMGLISASIHEENEKTKTFWLWKGEQNKEFIDTLYAMKNNIFVGYSIQQAESRCFAALGLDPNAFKWRDLMLEWRWLRNGDYRFSYGKVMKNGFGIYTVPPYKRVGKKASQVEIDEAKEINDEYIETVKSDLDFTVSDDVSEVSMQEAGWAMLDCCYFFDTINRQYYNSAIDIKHHVRDNIIIKGTEKDIENNKQEILDYNSGDVADLLILANKLTEEMEKVGEESYFKVLKGDLETGISLHAKDILKIQLEIGEWAARLAKYGQRGLPLNPNRLERLLEVVPLLQQKAKVEWNTEHLQEPLYRVGLTEKMLYLKKSMLMKSPYIGGSFTKDNDMLENIINTFCKTAGIEKFPKTKTGKVDTSKKVIDRFASGENLLKQYQRHQGHLSSLRAFTADKDGVVDALNYIGQDCVQRPDFGPYGTQTARNAAKAKSLCFLGPHWMRILVDPEPGKVVIDLDYHSEEVFIAASISGDVAMKHAYASSDIYMYYAQIAGMYPKDLPIPTETQRSEEWFKPYKKTRSIAKTLNLSIQFGASPKAVAAAIRDATHDLSITDEDGEEFVLGYHEAYPDYSYIVGEIKNAYKLKNSILLPDGWRMGPDNPSVLSAGNVPVQGLGSVILREACRELDKAGYKVIATLHDAVTLYADEKDAEEVAEKAKAIMEKAAENVLGESGMRVGEPEILHHGEIWLHSERAVKDWEKLKKSFVGTF